MRQCPECRNSVADAARFCPSCGAATTADAGDPWMGRVVNGKFRIEALVGQGGMGRVYRAHHLTLDRPVVLKMLHRDYSSDPQVVQRFQREARAASRLNHPNSIAVLDFGEAEDGALFMAMEYLAGRDLARIVSDEFPLGEARIVRIAAQILSALAEAHAQGIIHRDLKPENVMVEPRRDEPDFVKVLDFGIAKITAPGANEPKLTQAGLVCGTPEYMSPEQARGADLDARTDLYSMGVILYQMATGELPFQSDTPVGFLTKHLSEAPVPAKERRSDLSDAFDAVIARAIDKDPAKRFQTADEMRAALLACAAAPVAVPSGARKKGRVAEPRRARKGFRAFAAVVALVGGGAIAFVAKQNAATWIPTWTPTPTTPTSTSTPTPTSTSTSTPTSTPTPTSTSTVAKTVAGTAAHPERSQREAPAESKGRRDSAKALALFKKGEARRADQDVDGAIKLYLQAEAADPDLAAVQKKLALCYQLKGDTRRAADRYRKYLATGPADAERVRMILSTLR